MLKPLFALCVCGLLASCATINEMRESGVLDKCGSFQLNPVEKNNYWYNGTTYEYNLYEIRITSEPGGARIIWDGKYAGTTPFSHPFTGSVEKGDRIGIRAIPLDPDYKPQDTVLKVARELPREINFVLER